MGRTVPSAWYPIPHTLAFYNGRESSLRRAGFVVRVLAEARGARTYVEAIGRADHPVRFNVKTENLSPLPPSLFDVEADSGFHEALSL